MCVQSCFGMEGMEARQRKVGGDFYVPFNTVWALHTSIQQQMSFLWK